MKFFQNLPKKAPKSGVFGQKGGGLFEFCISGGLIKSGGLLARIRYVIKQYGLENFPLSIYAYYVRTSCSI